MGRPSEYPRELRERAVRMVAEVRADYPREYQAMTAVAQMLGIGSPETIRTWIRREQVDAGDRPGVTTDAQMEIKRRKRENAELRRANEILKAASAFFAAVVDSGRTRPATQAIVDFIDEHKDRTEGGLRWGVESICAALTQHGVKIAPSTYYDARGRGRSPQAVSDERWKPIILAAWQAHRMTTPLVLACLDMALFTRRRQGVTGFEGLTHHTDAVSVYTSIAFTDRLVDEGIDPSVGSVGDAYDNSLAESQIGLYKSELIHHAGPWWHLDQVEAATASWVLWFNTERTHGSIDDFTTLEVEQLDYARNEPVERAG